MFFSVESQFLKSLKYFPSYNKIVKVTGWSKSLFAPDDYNTKKRKNILNSFTYLYNAVRIKDTRWR
jgi:hypothetical protein